MRWRWRRRVPPWALDGLVVGLAVSAFGVAFGVLSASAGIPLSQTCALSLLVFTGASQFVVVGVLEAGGTVGAALASALLLASRNGLYGLALRGVLRGSRLRRALGAQLVIDETTAMATARSDPDEREGAFWVTGLAVFVFWNLGTLVGALGGAVIGDPTALGLDAAFPAGFIALIAPQLRTPTGRVAAAGGAVVALAALPFTPPGVPVLLGALGVLPALALARRIT